MFWGFFLFYEEKDEIRLYFIGRFGFSLRPRLVSGLTMRLTVTEVQHHVSLYTLWCT